MDDRVGEFKKRLQGIEERMEAACRRAGRNPQEVQLMGVSKFQGPRDIEAAFEGGLRIFGESRVQEGIEKFTPLKAARPQMELHLVGSLQGNKAKRAAEFFDCIQSVDRISLIEALGKMERPAPLRILLEYRTGEESKAGFSQRDDLYRAAELVLSFPGLFPGGLMTMAPNTRDEALVRRAFRELAAAQGELQKRFPGTGDYWTCLSMGMSGDYDIAIEEGSTMIRIGTALFGEAP
ncbi:MAG: YggS family pyridoxal phosphate-dependent enzyme [Treponema sp.]|nr:YggS family pyridoxal phosphate-dependent enzyme [Treponema sp.]